MKFVTLCKWRKKPTKQMVDETNRLRDKATKEGLKVLSVDWTLGRYDMVVITECADEKIAMKALLEFGDLFSTETLVAVSGKEAVQLIK